ncbi:SusC/RagA family TonB-linked outer membrane protein [Gelidibacter salicanalis]|uniref:TonB-dependent receptor n=1 Tax=Gelidibacter salicanalis TaxID=291193 RepID=A0A934KPK2_9FLAO|nr:TonB-dependent receptor [Gelidibacter salicanalis]MBJ7879785.1 TonB-dependent receptor [Gelidibacter salicanalis]
MKKRNSNIIYMIFILLFALPALSFGQEKTITGTIISSTDKIPLTGATVIVKGTSTGAVTDFDGNYTITANSGDVLVFSFVGFQNKEVTVATQTVINVSLAEDTAMLDEIVITGYGKQSRATLTTSISKLDTQILETSSRSNAATALQGTIAGLRVTNNTGQPGSTPSIVLRGGTTFGGGGSPLILIDGVPGSFYALNADDIESIEVLKDAAATAIYGARSANGVILVTTKTGKVGRSSINYKYKYSMNNRRDDQEFLGAADFIKYNRQAVAYYNEVTGRTNFDSGFLNNGRTAFSTGNNTTDSAFTTQFLTDENRYLLGQPGWKTVEDPLNPGKQILYLDNDVSDNIYQQSEIKDHYLSFDGGNEKGTYYLGLGFLDNDGLILGSGFKRYSGKFSGSYKIKENLRVNSNILYAHSNLSRSPLGSDDTVFRRFAGQAPTSRTYDTNPDGTMSTILSPGTNTGFGNPLYYQDKFVRKNLEQRLTASVGVDWDILKSLTASVQGSHFTINNHNEFFAKAFRQGSTSATLNTSRDASTSLTRTLRNQVTATLAYTKKIGNHNFNALLGTEYFKENVFSSYAATKGSPTDLIFTLNAGAEPTGASSYETEYALVSTFGRLLYDFDSKYLFSATFRRDGSSQLGNEKFDFFPSVSLGWNAHNEEFIQNSFIGGFVSRLKPRVSYGSNGNLQVISDRGNFLVFGSYGSQGTYNGQTGYGNTGLPTLDLVWEKSTTFNVGLDLSFFDNRINFIADVYSRDVKDKLADLTLPYYTGFGSILTNNGTLRNKGFELEMNADIIRNDNLTWNIGATVTTNKNYVIKLPENDNPLNRQGGTEIFNPATGQNEWVGGLQEGQRVGNDLIVTYEQDYIYADQAAVDAHATRVDELLNDPTKRFPGDVAWVDQNGDNIINSLDRKVIGRATPNFVGGLTTSLTYKNFNLFVKTDFATGHMINNHIRAKGYAQTQGNLNQPIEVLNSWTPTNTNTDLPRFVFVDAQANILRGATGSTRFWEKGDYLALREVTLSYNIPATYFNDVINNLSVYITGSNLHYFKSYSGDSPEEGGVQLGEFPMPRTITIGLNVSF